MSWIMLIDHILLQLAAKLEALRDEYMRFAVEKCASVLREYHSAVETVTGLLFVYSYIQLLDKLNHPYCETL